MIAIVIITAIAVGVGLWAFLRILEDYKRYNDD